MKRKLLILFTTLLLSCSVVGCDEETVVNVNVEETDNLSNNKFGTSALIEIGDGLYYDSTTGVVYFWNGLLGCYYHATTPSPYYAPNGLPYKYNTETNTFEMIGSNEVE